MLQPLLCKARASLQYKLVQALLNVFEMNQTSVSHILAVGHIQSTKILQAPYRRRALFLDSTEENNTRQALPQYRGVLNHHLLLSYLMHQCRSEETVLQSHEGGGCSLFPSVHSLEIGQNLHIELPTRQLPCQQLIKIITRHKALSIVSSGAFLDKSTIKYTSTMVTVIICVWSRVHYKMLSNSH